MVVHFDVLYTKFICWSPSHHHCRVEAHHCYQGWWKHPSGWCLAEADPVLSNCACGMILKRSEFVYANIYFYILYTVNIYTHVIACKERIEDQIWIFFTCSNKMKVRLQIQQIDYVWLCRRCSSISFESQHNISQPRKANWWQIKYIITIVSFCLNTVTQIRDVFFSTRTFQKLSNRATIQVCAMHSVQFARSWNAFEHWLCSDIANEL